jgi:hypothetical protein
MSVSHGGDTAFWHVTPCSLVDRYRRFVATYCGHLKSVTRHCQTCACYNSHYRGLVTTELEGIRKEAIRIKFKAMFQYLLGWTHVMHVSWYRSCVLNLVLPDLYLDRKLRYLHWRSLNDLSGAEFSFKSWHSRIWWIPCFQATTWFTLDSRNVSVSHSRPVELGAHPDTHLL